MKCPKILIGFILHIILCLTFIPGVDNRRIQKFALYSLTEQIENFTRNVPNLDLVSDIVRENRLQSVCSQMGVWAFFTGKNYTTVNSYGYHPATPGWTCSNRRIQSDWQSPFRSLRHLGNVDLDTPSISLYKDPFFASEELYVNGHALSFTGLQFDFGSFGFTGRDSWTLYAEPDFKGDTVCLQCNCDPAGLSIGVTYTAKLTLSASSIRRGCFGNQVLRPSGVLEKRVPSGFQLNAQNQNFISLTLSQSDANASLTFSGTEIRLPCMTTFDVFQISGRSNWTIYSGADFDGNSACLVYSQSDMGGRGQTRARFDIVSEPTNFKAMTVTSLRFGCKQNLAKDKSNPIPAFFASRKQPSPDQSLNTKNPARVTPSPNTPSPITPTSFREGRGPVYIPGDIEGLAERPTTKRKPEPTFPTNIPVIVNYQPSTSRMPIFVPTRPPTEPHFPVTVQTNTPIIVNYQSSTSRMPKLVPTPPPAQTPFPVTVQTNTPVMVNYQPSTSRMPKLVPTPLPAQLPFPVTVQPQLQTQPTATSQLPLATFPESEPTFQRPTESTKPTAQVSSPKPVEFITSTASVHENLVEPSILSSNTNKPQPTTHSVSTPRSDDQVVPSEPPVVKKNDRGNEVDAPPIRHASSHEAATINDHDSGAAGMFFTAFLIILGILVAAMIVTIGVFIYLRSTRSAEVDIE